MGYNFRTFFGGVMTVLMVAGLTGYMVNRLITIYTTREYSYLRRDYTYTEE